MNSTSFQDTGSSNSENTSASNNHVVDVAMVCLDLVATEIPTYINMTCVPAANGNYQ